MTASLEIVIFWEGKGGHYIYYKTILLVVLVVRGEIMEPKEYGLPHVKWRPHQRKAAEWATNMQGVAIVEAPTGSGKTALAAALGHSRPAIALVRTKALQHENYEVAYNFDALYGRGNYTCSLTGAKPGTMADNCAYAEEGMNKCPQYGECAYVQARELAKQSNKAALNYPYWLHVYSKWATHHSMMVCDEAHQLPDIVLDWAGCTVTEYERVRWNLPRFPILKSRGGKSIITKTESTTDQTINWLITVRAELLRLYLKFNQEGKTNQEALKNARHIELLGKKVRATIDAMSSCPDDWYIQSGPNVLTYKGKKTWGFIARPLTARHHFGRYFLSDKRSLLAMSATIGNPKTFASELGLTDYEFRRIESVWPVESRPIHALDIPRLGRKSGPTEWGRQADMIAEAINGLDPTWHGMIHVTSKVAATGLAERLAHRGLQDRVWVPPRVSTDEMMLKWHDQMDRKPGQIAVSWAMWEGYNGTREKICIAAKTPYPYLGDPYEKARQAYDGKFYLQRAAWQLEQGLGRTRRGREEDYDDGDSVAKYVAIADGGWKWLRNYMSESVLEAVIQ